MFCSLARTCTPVYRLLSTSLCQSSLSSDPKIPCMIVIAWSFSSIVSVCLFAEISRSFPFLFLAISFVKVSIDRPARKCCGHGSQQCPFLREFTARNGIRCIPPLVLAQAHFSRGNITRLILSRLDCPPFLKAI
jgi:hypothetical protein